jgi:hypothetical protein
MAKFYKRLSFVLIISSASLAHRALGRTPAPPEIYERISDTKIADPRLLELVQRSTNALALAHETLSDEEPNHDWLKAIIERCPTLLEYYNDIQSQEIKNLARVLIAKIHEILADVLTLPISSSEIVASLRAIHASYDAQLAETNTEKP